MSSQEAKAKDRCRAQGLRGNTGGTNAWYGGGFRRFKTVENKTTEGVLKSIRLIFFFNDQVKRPALMFLSRIYAFFSSAKKSLRFDELSAKRNDGLRRPDPELSIRAGVENNFNFLIEKKKRGDKI